MERASIGVPEAFPGQPEIRSGGGRATGVRLGAMDGRCAPILPRSGGAPASEPLLPHTHGRCESWVEHFTKKMLARTFLFNTFADRAAIRGGG